MIGLLLANAFAVKRGETAKKEKDSDAVYTNMYKLEIWLRNGREVWLNSARNPKESELLIAAKQKVERESYGENPSHLLQRVYDLAADLYGEIHYISIHRK